MKIFVGNLLFSAVEADVERAFAAFGAVASVEIVKEKGGVKSRGFGFVDMPDQKQAEDAIAGLEGKEFMGRALNVSPARPKSEEEHQEEVKKRAQEKLSVRVQIRQRNDMVRKAQWAAEGLAKTGGYMGGRRTRSFIRKLTEKAPPAARPQRARPWEAAVKPPKPWRKSHALEQARGRPQEPVDPGRPSKPWQKPEVSQKPWKKPEASQKPWQKSERPQKPWQRPESPAKSRKKTEYAQRFSEAPVVTARKSRKKIGASTVGPRYTKDYVRPAHKQLAPKPLVFKSRAPKPRAKAGDR